MTSSGLTKVKMTDSYDSHSHSYDSSCGPGSRSVSPLDGKSISPLDVKFQLSDSQAEGRPSPVSYLSMGGCTHGEGYDFIMKVILLGDQGVGKSSFLKALKVHPDVEKATCACHSGAGADHLGLTVTTSGGKRALVRLCD